ncbi:MAG: glycosyltransferase family 2 protein [Azonexus sp.]
MSQNIVSVALMEKRVGNVVGAMNILVGEVGVNPKNSWARLELSRIYIESGDLFLAKKVASEGLEFCVDVYNLYAALSEIELIECNVDGAIKLARLGYISNPNICNAAFPFFRVLAKNGCFDVLASEVDGFIKNAPRAEVDRTLFHLLPLLSIKGLHPDNSFRVVWHKPSEKSDSLSNAMIFILMKNEIDIIRHNVVHHYSLGFRFFCVLDNNSIDGSMESISSLEKMLVDAVFIKISDPCVVHLQGAKTTLAVRYAVDYLRFLNVVIEWVFPVDADEFINTPISLSAVLLSVPSEAKILVFNSRNVATEKVFDIISESDSLSDDFSLPKNSSVFLNPSVKVAFRFSCAAEVADGNHFVNKTVCSLDDVYFLGGLDICINHLPIRSVEQIKAKTINGAQAIADLQVGAHWKERYQKFLRRGDVVFREIVENFISG